ARDEAPVLEVFARHAARHPDRPCVVFEGRSWTYGEIDLRASRLANRLLRLKLGAEDRVALSLERGPGLAIGILGIWRAGAAYVPIDPEEPADRRAFLIEDSGAAAVVSD